MFKSKSLLTMMLAAVVMVGSIVPTAAAVEPTESDNSLQILDSDWNQEADGYQGETPITFEVVNEHGGGSDDPSVFSVYVPTVLPMLMDLEGNVVAPTNAKVINGVEDRAVQVEGMEAAATGSMELVSMEEAAEAAPDEKVFGFSLAGEDMAGDMASLPIRIEADGELDLNMQVEMPTQSETQAESEIATVLFTFGWADKSDSDIPNPSNGLVQSIEDAQAMGFTFSPYEDGLQIDSFTNTQSQNEVNVPEQIGDLKILSIGDGVFKGQTNLTKITLPDTVKNIGNSAFQNCTGLTSFYLSSSVKNLGWYAFQGAGAKGSTIIINSNCLGKDFVGDSGIAPFYKTKFSNIIVGDAVTAIGNSCFGSAEMVSITLPASVKVIGRMAFDHCPYLESVVISDGVEEIEFLAFGYCESLSSITIPGSVTEIGKSAFSRCTGLSSVTIQDGVKKIGDSAFDDCTSLASVSIPDSVTEIGSYAFADCTALSGIDLPDGLISIGRCAFDGCTKLASVIIPDSATSIDYMAFRDVPHIEYHGTASGSPWGAKSMN